MTDGHVLEFSHATKRFGVLTAVDDLSTRIEPGAVTAFLGPNGAGKTTSLRMLLGQIRPSSGTATIGGVSHAELRHPLRTIGAVLEEAVYRPRRTAPRQLTIAARANGIPLSRVDEVLALVGLQNEHDTRIGAYSLGMRQRLSIAGALLGDPGALVLDEPANGLDPEGIRWMRILMRRLADEGRTVLVSSHVLSEIEQVADHVLVLSRGRLMYADSIGKLSDPNTGSVVVDAADRAGLIAAVQGSGLSFDVLRSGLTVHNADAAAVGALAAAAGVALSTLQQRGPSLEEVFLDLVHGRRDPMTGAIQIISAPLAELEAPAAAGGAAADGAAALASEGAQTSAEGATDPAGSTGLFPGAASVAAGAGAVAVGAAAIGAATLFGDAPGEASATPAAAPIPMTRRAAAEYAAAHAAAGTGAESDHGDEAGVAEADGAASDAPDVDPATSTLGDADGALRDSADQQVAVGESPTDDTDVSEDADASEGESPEHGTESSEAFAAHSEGEPAQDGNAEDHDGAAEDESSEDDSEDDSVEDASSEHDSVEDASSEAGADEETPAEDGVVKDDAADEDEPWEQPEPWEQSAAADDDDAPSDHEGSATDSADADNANDGELSEDSANDDDSDGATDEAAAIAAGVALTAPIDAPAYAAGEAQPEGPADDAQPTDEHDGAEEHEDTAADAGSAEPETDAEFPLTHAPEEEPRVEALGSFATSSLTIPDAVAAVSFDELITGVPATIAQNESAPDEGDSGQGTDDEQPTAEEHAAAEISDDQPADGAPADGASEDEASEDEASEDEALTDEAPTEEAHAEETPVDGAAADGAPADEESPSEEPSEEVGADDQGDDDSHDDVRTAPISIVDESAPQGDVPTTATTVITTTPSTAPDDENTFATPEPSTETTEIAGIEIFAALAEGRTQEIQVILDEPHDEDDLSDDVIRDEIRHDEDPRAAAVSASLAAAARAFFSDEAPAYTPAPAAAEPEQQAEESEQGPAEPEQRDDEQAERQGEHNLDGGHHWH